MQIQHLTLTPAETARLRDELIRIVGLPESKVLRDLLRTKFGSRFGHEVVSMALDYSYAAVETALEPENFALLRRFAETPGDDMLVIENLPERPELDDESRNMVNPDLGLSMADLMSYFYARLLGTQHLPSFKIDQVTGSNDDNLHQDAAHRGLGARMFDYAPADCISLQCIRPGQGGHASTLYSDLDSIIAQLPEDIARTIAAPRFIPEGGHTTLPLVVEKGGRWQVHPAFALTNPFSAGGLSATDLRTDAEGRRALAYFADYKPTPSNGMFESIWKPGMHVLARQERLFHRRYVEGDARVEGRLLNRVRLFADGAPGERPTESLDQLRANLEFGLTELMKDAAPEIAYARSRWKMLAGPDPELAEIADRTRG